MFKELFVEAAPREYKRFNPKDFKKGDKVIVTFRTPSGHLEEDKPGVVIKVHENGLEIKHGNSQHNRFVPEIGIDDVRKA